MLLKRILHIVFPFILLLECLCSCSTLKTSIPSEGKYNLAWAGKSYAEIVASFGAPERITSDSNDGNILVYEKTTYSSQTDEFTHIVTTVPHTSYLQFFLDSEDKCYLVKGNMPYEDEQYKKQKKLRNGLFKGGFFVGMGASFLL